MKLARTITAIALLALAVPAFAGGKTLTLITPASVNGTKLDAGDYKVDWDQTGKVTFSKGKKVVAEANGKVVTTEKAARHTTLRKKDANILSIQFENSKNEIILDQTETASSEAK
jgi:hypothetical protein